ncbi:MAG: Ezrin/radixin/moesin family protein [Bacteroidota bacterium]
MMKKTIPLIIIILCFGVIDAAGQMNKTEKREWKKRIKKLEPEQYKQLLDENKSLKGQLSSVKSELNGVDDRIAEKDQQILTYQEQVSDLRNELEKAQNQVNTQNVANTESDSSIDEDKGVVFKVQLGAFKKKDLKKYDNSPNFSAENKDGFQKLTVGVFRDYWEADRFKKELRAMGAKEAWVVSYKDGQRVPIKDVLEGVTKKS